MVVLDPTPSSLPTSLRSNPSSSMWTAKLCLRHPSPQRLPMPALETAPANILCRVLGEIPAALERPGTSQTESSVLVAR